MTIKFTNPCHTQAGIPADSAPSLDVLAWVETADKYRLVDALGEMIVPQYESCQEVNVYFDSMKEQRGSPYM